MQQQYKKMIIITCKTFSFFSIYMYKSNYINSSKIFRLFYKKNLLLSILYHHFYKIFISIYLLYIIFYINNIFILFYPILLCRFFIFILPFLSSSFFFLISQPFLLSFSSFSFSHGQINNSSQVPQPSKPKSTINLCRPTSTYLHRQHQSKSLIHMRRQQWLR